MAYMVFVDGRKNPRFVHPTRESAETEAARLQAQPNNLDRKILLLEILSISEPPEARTRPVDNGICDARPILTLKRRASVDAA